MTEPDIKYLSLGGGLQSSTIAELMVEGELPRVDVALFADTGDEPDYVYKQVEYLRGRLDTVGIPLEVVTTGNIIEALQDTNNRFASIPVFTKQDGKVGRLRRQCTREFKIEPIERRVRELLVVEGKARVISDGRIRPYKGTSGEAWLGITVDEVGRVKDSRTSWIKNRWPLLEPEFGLNFTRASCLQWLAERGLPTPKKSSCRICPYHGDPYWREIRENRPGDWEHVVEIDSFLRSGEGRFTASTTGELFLHRQCVPIKEVKFDEQPELPSFGEQFCESGYCFV